MPTKEQRDQYASEVARRFEEFTSWAIQHWPEPGAPLLSSDFTESRKEVGMLLGRKLRDADSGSQTPAANESEQYIDVTPAPWP